MIFLEYVGSRASLSANPEKNSLNFSEFSFYMPQ